MQFLEKKWQGKTYRFHVKRDRDSLWIHFKGQTWLWKNEKDITDIQKPTQQKQELITSGLPGKIQKVFVKPSDVVIRGQNLLILSSMKIEYIFKADGNAQVKEVFCEAGQIVSEGALLIKLKFLKV